MTWTILTTKRFEEWFDEQNDDLQERVLAVMGRLQFWGPGLSRPFADTVKGSRFANMKELRVQHHGKPIMASPSGHFIFLIIAVMQFCFALAINRKASTFTNLWSLSLIKSFWPG